MNRFDANCVIGRWAAGGPTILDADQLLTSMKRLGITKSLVRHTMAQEYAPSAGNELLMQQISGYPELLPCWAALPTATGELGPLDAWLESAAAHNVRAFALYPHSHNYPLTDWQCGELLTGLQAQHALLLIEADQTDYDRIDWLCGAYPQINVLLLNCGYRVLRILYALLDAHPNLYLEMGMISNFCGLEALAARFGAERLVFGSGVPKREGAGFAAIMDYSLLDDADTALIAQGNLERLLEEVRR